MRLLAVLIGAVWLCCQTAQAQVRTYDEMIAAAELKVAVYKDFAPYSFEDAGEARGVDVELAQALAKAMGVRLKLIWAPAGEKARRRPARLHLAGQSAAQSATGRPDDARAVRSRLLTETQ